MSTRRILKPLHLSYSLVKASSWPSLRGRRTVDQTTIAIIDDEIDQKTPSADTTPTAKDEAGQGPDVRRQLKRSPSLRKKRKTPTAKRAKHALRKPAKALAPAAARAKFRPQLQQQHESARGALGPLAPLVSIATSPVVVCTEQQKSGNVMQHTARFVVMVTSPKKEPQVGDTTDTKLSPNTTAIPAETAATLIDEMSAATAVGVPPPSDETVESAEIVETTAVIPETIETAVTEIVARMIGETVNVIEIEREVEETIVVIAIEMIDGIATAIAIETKTEIATGIVTEVIGTETDHEMIGRRTEMIAEIGTLIDISPVVGGTD